MPLRKDLLNILKKNTPNFVSGEQICRQLGVSRTAIWKQIEVLRSMGYEVEARSNAGYRLVSIPDRVYPQEVVEGLETSTIGHEMKHFLHLDSTNEYAKKWAREDARDGAVVIAEEQGSGRGRLGRGWFSPEGKGLWFSVVLRPHLDIMVVSQVTLLTAVAIATGIYKNTGYAPGIKWPNDLLAPGAGNKKMCGILTEVNADMDSIYYVVVGVGLNVNIFNEDIPGDLEDVVTSIGQELDRKVDRVKLLRSLLEELDYWYRVWLEKGFTPVMEKWREWNVTLGRRVRVTTINDVVEGLAEDLSEKGALRVKLDSGEIKEFLVGEISIR